MTKRQRRWSARAERRRRTRLAERQQSHPAELGIAEARLLHQRGLLSEAERAYRALLESEPGQAEAHHLLGVLLLQTGRTAAALPSLRQAAALAPGNPDVLNNLGEAERLNGHLEAAEAAYRDALGRAPSMPSALNNLALVLKSRGAFDEALGTLTRALALDPGDLELRLNHADTLATAERFEDALSEYDRIVEQAAGSSAAFYGRAYVLYVLERLEEAETAAARAVQLDPGHDRAVELLARIRVAVSDYAGASDAFLVTVRRRHAPDLIPANEGDRQRLFRANRLKLEHELERLRYLQQAGEQAEPALEALCEEYAQALSAVKDAPPDEIIRIDELGLARVRQHHNRLLREWFPAALPGGALHPDLDAAAIEERFLDEDTGLVYFDALLCPEALETLQRFALIASCWFKTDQYSEIAATPGTGFCCPLIMQIAGESRLRFPRLLGPHYFNTLWGLKFYEPKPGLGRHIDDAAMSINFWITPDAANRDDSTGGLAYWNKEITEPGFFDHRLDTKTRLLDDVLAEPDTERLRVPYRCNRAMLFRSTVIHGTEPVDFDTRYESRRVNITCLYGRSRSARPV